MQDILLYILVGLGAVFAVLSAATASYLAELRDESESSGVSIEEVFNWHRLAVTLGISIWIGGVGLAGAIVAINYFIPDLAALDKYLLAIIVGSGASFLNRATIALARSRLPDLVNSIFNRK